MTSDVQAPGDFRALQEAAVRVLESHRFDYETVARIKEMIKDALAGSFVSTHYVAIRISEHEALRN